MASTTSLNLLIVVLAMGAGVVWASGRADNAAKFLIQCAVVVFLIRLCIEIFGP